MSPRYAKEARSVHPPDRITVFRDRESRGTLGTLGTLGTREVIVHLRNPDEVLTLTV